MVNSGQTVIATVQTPGGMPRYDGDAQHRRRARHGGADSRSSFADAAGSICGALLPTGRAVDRSTAST